MTYREAFMEGYNSVMNKFAYESSANIRNNIMLRNKRNMDQQKMMERDHEEEEEEKEIADENRKKGRLARYKPNRVQSINRASGGVHQLNNDGAGCFYIK